MQHLPQSASIPQPAQMVCECGPRWKEYFIFFAPGSDVLTAKARNIVALVATESKEQGFSSITVSGFTDTSESSVDNQKLSLRRAHVVGDLLSAEGVSAKWITVKAYGATHLLVPTEAGVSYGPNRRVEIIRKIPAA